MVYLIQEFTEATTLQYIMKAKVSKHKFWHCPENGLIKTIHMMKSDKVRIMALIRNDIPFKIREDLMTSRVQTIWIEIVRKNSKNILVGGVYRTWSDDQDGDADIILDQFEKATEENLPVAILGDMNLDIKKWAKKEYDPDLKKIAQKWKSCLAKSGLKIENMGLTWRSHGVFNGEKRFSALDHIYHTEDKVFSSFRTITNSMSDHFKPILCTIHIKQPKMKIEDTYILRRCWKYFIDKDFIWDLVNQPWEQVINPSKNANQQGRFHAFPE